MLFRGCGFLVVGLAMVLSACGGSKSPAAPSANVPFSTTDLRVGTGAEAAIGRVVTVNYTGWLYDAGAAANKGTQFDTSLSPGRTPLPVALGSGGVIPGFERGIIGMRVGGQRLVVIPPELGYGSRGSGSTIPPNATLIFELELVSIIQ